MIKNWLYLSLEEILLLQKMELNRFGGSHGIRDKRLLISAIGQAELVLFDEPVYKHAYEIAAVYVYHIIKNHPFIDGNKRVGILVAITFLRINGLNVQTNNKELYNLAIDIASSKIDKQTVMKFFKDRIQNDLA